MEAILENIPTGVVSLNSSGEIARVNTAVASILGDYARTAATLQELLGEDAARDVLHLMRRSLRMGAASHEIEIAAGGRLVRTAVTVSSLGPRKANPGLRRRDRRLDRPAARAENRSVAGGGAANRARDQEPADADSDFSATPAEIFGPHSSERNWAARGRNSKNWQPSARI